VFLVLIIYYEIKLYNNSFCENKTVLVKNLKFFVNDQFLLQLNNKINGFLRFGYEYQNFILSLISQKNQNNQIILEENEIEFLQDLNK
jgi:hypothetical protein